MSRNRRVFFPQFGEVGARTAQLLLHRLARRIRHGTMGIVGFHLVIDQHIDGVLLPCVFEEIFLSPALEHAIGHVDGGQIPAAGEGRRLMPVRAEPGDLTEASFLFKKRTAWSWSRYSTFLPSSLAWCFVNLSSAIWRVRPLR